jgi:hypothetical protein
MTYRFRDMVAVLFLGMIIGVAIVGSVIVDANADVPRNDAEGIAGCISEYDYTHPKGNRFNNLVRAIQWCNVGDRATMHGCITPCRVILPKGTLEDEFGIGYGWKDRRTPMVDVYVKGRD